MLYEAHPFAKLPAKDVERARRFYADVLGLRVSLERPGHRASNTPTAPPSSCF